MKHWDGHEFTAAGGTRMHASWCGPPSAPTVVCVPGQGLSHRYFLPLARALTPQAHTLAVDPPGFGRTRGPRRVPDVRGQSEALADWLRRTGRGGAVHVGNSTGCQVLVDMAWHAPELLGPMVLVSPSVDSRLRSWRSQVLRNPLHWPLERPGLPLVMMRDYLDCGPRRALRNAAQFLPDPIERKAPLVPTRSLVVRGKLDPMTSGRWARALTEQLPEGHLVELVASHAIHWSRPQLIADLVRELLPTTADDASTAPRATAPGVRPGVSVADADDPTGR